MIILVRMSKDEDIRIKKISGSDSTWITDFYQRRWGSSHVVTRGVIHDVPSLRGFIAMKSDKRIGLLCYRIDNQDFEIVTLDSLEEKIGVGSALIEKAVETARSESCRRIWLITTNDNSSALRFYQKLGFHLVAVHRNALEYSRKLKPEIPIFGQDGIPLRDEIELELII